MKSHSSLICSILTKSKHVNGLKIPYTMQVLEAELPQVWKFTATGIWVYIHTFQVYINYVDLDAPRVQARVSNASPSSTNCPPMFDQKQSMTGSQRYSKMHRLGCRFAPYILYPFQLLVTEYFQPFKPPFTRHFRLQRLYVAVEFANATKQIVPLF